MNKKPTLSMIALLFGLISEEEFKEITEHLSDEECESVEGNQNDNA